MRLALTTPASITSISILMPDPSGLIRGGDVITRFLTECHYGISRPKAPSELRPGGAGVR